MATRRGIGRAIDKGIFWAFLAVVVASPVPLGSNRAWAWSLLECGIFALVAAWLLAWTAGGARMPQPLVRAWPVFAALALWIADTAITVVPLPREWVATLSPVAAAMHGLADAAGGPQASFTLSLEPHASRIALIKSLAYSGAFFLTLAVVSNRSRFLVFAKVLVFAATLHALYALGMHASGTTQTYLGTVLVHRAAAMGFYANQNHFAGMLEMSIAVAIGLASYGGRGTGGSLRRAIVELARQVFTARMILRLALCVLVVALAATHSRMGNTAFLISLLVGIAIAVGPSREFRKGIAILVVSVVLLDLLVAGSLVGTEKLAQRLEATTVQDVEDRGAVARLSLGIVRDYPLFGSGAGTFYVAFPRYRTDAIANFFDHAHNDYVQFAAESGLVGLGLLAAVVLASLRSAYLAQLVRRDPAMKSASLACIMGVAALLVHSWADFNLQIPANAVLFMVLLAFGWIARFLDPSGAHAGPPGAGPQGGDVAKMPARQ
ncbi:MAG TPA: O-antigen ligase family protein [Usitatibacter sp.]|nr:O-antigen ligase family protein [Usitatibacter sp.]